MRFAGLLLALAVVPSLRAEESQQLKFLATLEGARPGAYSAIAFSPDGKVLAASDLGLDNDVSVVKVWDLEKRKVIATLRGKAGPSGDIGGFSLAFSPDGKTLAAGGRNVSLFDVATGREKASFKGGSPVAFSPDGKTLAAASDNQTVKLWDLSTGKAKASFKAHQESSLSGIFSLGFSPDSKFLACGTGTSASNGQPSGGEVILWDIATGRERPLLRDPIKLRITARSLSYLHKSEGVPKRVCLKLAALNGKEFRTEEELDRELPSVLEKILDRNERTKYLDVIRLEIRPVQEGLLSWVMGVAFTPDGKTLACGDVHGNVHLWDVQTRKRTKTLQKFNPHGREEDINGVYSVAFSPDGKLLATGTLRGIKLWNVQTGENVAGLNRPLGTVWSVVFSPDGKTVASAGSKTVIGMRDPREGDPTLRLWEWVRPMNADR
jgi:WD40 repeat protein